MASSCRYPKRERITREREFKAIYESGHKRVGRAFICFVSRRDGQGRKIGFSVSRKIGKAVVRNRVKRHIRETYRTHRSVLVDDSHIVIVARPAAAALNSRECAEAIRKLLREESLLCG